jgi:hypothetical protein
MKFQWGKIVCSLTTLSINKSRAGEAIIENASNHDAFNVKSSDLKIFHHFHDEL